MYVLSKVCHYAIKYSQIDAINLPSYMVKDQQGNMECELMCFQLIPAMVAFDFLSTSRCTYHKLSDVKSCVLYSFGMEAMRECNQQAYVFSKYFLQQNTLNQKECNTYKKNYSKTSLRKNNS